MGVLVDGPSGLRPADEPSLPLRTPWAQPVSDVLDLVHVDPAIGLTTAEAAERLARYGPNVLRTARRSRTAIVAQFRGEVVLLLVAAAAVSFSFADLLEGAAIVVVLALNAAIGFVTELRALRSMEALRRLGRVTATVRRGGLPHPRRITPGGISASALRWPAAFPARRPPGEGPGRRRPQTRAADPGSAHAGGTDLVIYGDFSSFACYLASHRVDALGAAGVGVDWRAVEWDRRLPVTGRRLDAADRKELADEQSEVAGLLLPGERLPWVMPGMVPKTEAAVSGYAEAYGAGVAAAVRRLLFAAYWVDGANIGDPEVLRRLLAGPLLRAHSDAEPLRRSGYAVSASRGPITTDAWLRIRAWRDEWARLGTGAVPTLVEDGGPPVTAKRPCAGWRRRSSG